MKTQRNLLLGIVLFSILNCSFADNGKKDLVLRFFRMAFVEQQVEKAFEQYVSLDHIQHNPNIPGNGARLSAEFLSAFMKKFPKGTISIERVIAEDNLVVIHARGKLSPEDRGIALVDIFRVEGDKIVEHWDVIQPMPERSENPHPMF